MKKGVRTGKSIRPRRLNDHQFDIITVIREGDPSGGFVDMDQLLERVKKPVRKEAMQFSVRFLIQRGLVTKVGRELRRGRKRVVFALTPLGSRMFGSGGGEDIMEEI